MPRLTTHVAGNIHLVPHGDGWAGKREGAARVSVIAETKAGADGLVRAIAKRDHLEMFIHGRDGRIQDRDSFGKDPHPPIDKEH